MQKILHTVLLASLVVAGLSACSSDATAPTTPAASTANMVGSYDLLAFNGHPVPSSWKVNDTTTMYVDGGSLDVTAEGFSPSVSWYETSGHSLTLPVTSLAVGMASGQPSFTIVSTTDIGPKSPGPDATLTLKSMDRGDLYFYKLHAR